MNKPPPLTWNPISWIVFAIACYMRMATGKWPDDFSV